MQWLRKWLRAFIYNGEFEGLGELRPQKPQSLLNIHKPVYVYSPLLKQITPAYIEAKIEDMLYVRILKGFSFGIPDSHVKAEYRPVTFLDTGKCPTCPYLELRNFDCV